MDQASPSSAESELLQTLTVEEFVTKRKPLNWSVDDIKLAIEMFNRNDSMGIIGQRVNRSRNAVAGLIKRVRLAGVLAVKPKLNKYATRTKSPILQQEIKSVQVVQPKSAIAVIALPKPLEKVRRIRLRLIDTDKEVTLLQLEPYHCRWPLGDPKRPDFRFCGCRKVADTVPYCAEHLRQSVAQRW